MRSVKKNQLSPLLRFGWFGTSCSSHRTFKVRINFCFVFWDRASSCNVHWEIKSLNCISRKIWHQLILSSSFLLFTPVAPFRSIPWGKNVYLLPAFATLSLPSRNSGQHAQNIPHYSLLGMDSVLHRTELGFKPWPSWTKSQHVFQECIKSEWIYHSKWPGSSPEIGSLWTQVCIIAHTSTCLSSLYL